MFDLPLEELQTYRGRAPEPQDFLQFWKDEIAASRAFVDAPEFVPTTNGLSLVDTYDVTFSGADGTAVKGWLNVPAGAAAPLPVVIQYRGYTSGRGFPLDNTLWAQAGYAHFIMDTRSQGHASGGPDGTVDDSPHTALNRLPGLMTSGIGDPETYYFRRLYIDAFRAVEAMRSSPLVDPARVIVTGISQGGGLAIAASALSALAGAGVLGCAPDVPLLSDFGRALAITDTGPYGEIVKFLNGYRDMVEQVHRTLSYFDVVNLGRFAQAPSLFSVGLMDRTCPPSTVFAAYNNYGARSGLQDQTEKDINVYAYNAHEGGQSYQVMAQLKWAAEILQGDPAK
ncbi:acetylxylan esterase [Nocardioides sp. AN3]